MAAESAAEHSYCTEFVTWLDVDAVSVTMPAIGPVHIGDSCQFCFWKNVCLAESSSKGLQATEDMGLSSEPTTWKVRGCISKVAFDASERSGTSQSCLSTWGDAVTAAKSALSEAYPEKCKELQQQEIEQPLLTVDRTKKLMGVFFKLVYTPDDVLAGCVPLALDENINVDSISEVFSGFQLKLRTSKCKAAKKLLKSRKAAMAQDSSVSGSSATGSPQRASASSGSSATGTSQRASASSATGSPPRGSPMKRVTTALASGSPFKRFASALAKSPIGRVSPSSATSSAQLGAAGEFPVYGLVNILQDKQNKSNHPPLYSLDSDLMTFLFGKFGCGKLKELQYVHKRKARDFCKKHDIIDPFK